MLLTPQVEARLQAGSPSHKTTLRISLSCHLLLHYTFGEQVRVQAQGPANPQVFVHHFQKAPAHVLRRRVALRTLQVP